MIPVNGKYDYNKIPELNGLMATVKASHDQMLEAKRTELLDVVQQCMGEIHRTGGGDSKVKAIIDKADNYYTQQKEKIADTKSSDYDYYDYLIGMDKMNIRNMERMTNHKKGEKIALMLEYAGLVGSECQDPWYNSRFDQTYRDVVTGCTAFLEYLEKEGKI